MDRFSIKDLLLHILHGSIIVCAFLLLTTKGNEFWERICNYGDKGTIVTFLALLSYLIGLILDPVSDCLETFLLYILHKFGFKCSKSRLFQFFPSYYLLKDGEVCNRYLAHYTKVRNILNEDAKKDFDVEKIAKILRKRKYNDIEAVLKAPEIRKNLWEEPLFTIRLFQYAKNRAFAKGNEYQLSRVESYFRLFIFYRNMVCTSFLCMLFPLLLPSSFCYKWITIPFVLLVMYFFYRVSYTYRIYYCRMILGAVYSPCS